MYVSCCVVAIEKGWEFDDQGNVFKPKPAEGNVVAVIDACIKGTLCMQ